MTFLDLNMFLIFMRAAVMNVSFVYFSMGPLLYFLYMSILSRVDLHIKKFNISRYKITRGNISDDNSRRSWARAWSGNILLLIAFIRGNLISLNMLIKIIVMTWSIRQSKTLILNNYHLWYLNTNLCLRIFATPVTRFRNLCLSPVRLISSCNNIIVMLWSS